MAAQDSYPGVPPGQAQWGRDSQGNPVPVVVVHAPPGGDQGYGGGSSAARRSSAILWMGMLIGGLAIACVLLGFAYLDARGKVDTNATAVAELKVAKQAILDEQKRVETWRSAYFSVEDDYTKLVRSVNETRRQRGLAPVEPRSNRAPLDAPRSRTAS
jgi:hypothetical protein